MTHAIHTLMFEEVKLRKKRMEISHDVFTPEGDKMELLVMLTNDILDCEKAVKILSEVIK